MANNKKKRNPTSPQVAIQNNLKKLPDIESMDFQALGAINTTDVDFDKHFKKRGPMTYVEKEKKKSPPDYEL